MILLVPVLISSLTAQNRAPLLDIKGEEKTDPLILTKLSVGVKIAGLIAETKMTMTFYNPNNRELEGELVFPLPRGATICGYALDINGKMVDGAAVEKHRGREVFEKIVRRGIDPGLIEMVKGNNFRTRVYPILSRNSRTISVSYLSELIYRDKKVLFHLPLDFKEKIKDFSIEVDVNAPGIKPVIKDSAFAGFEFSSMQGRSIAKTILKDVLLNKDLLIELPQAGKQRVYVEQDPQGAYYFCIQDPDPVYKVKKEIPVKIPRHITILWDASGSRGKVDHKKEILLLESFFQGAAISRERTAKIHKKKIKVDLVFFRNRRLKGKRFTIKDGDCRKLIKAIKTIDYDGGTDMGSISPPAKENVPGFYLLFTDGISNFGRGEVTGFKAPLYIVSASSSANHSYLELLSRQTGGIYFNLSRENEQSIIKRIGSSPYGFISAVFDKKKIDDIVPGTPLPLRGPFFLTGKLKAPKGEVTLNFGIKGKTLKKVSYTIRREDAAAGKLLRTFWAQKKIEYLRVFAKKNKKELIAVGKKYGMVTPYTSLIVLENLTQYVEFEIAPPATLPQMRGEYEKAMAEKKEEKKEEQEKMIDSVLELWQERLEWWNEEYELPDEEKVRKKSVGPGKIKETLPVVVRPGEESINGIVLLPDGSAIPGVTVTLSSGAAGSRTTVTDEEGEFRFPRVPPEDVFQLKCELEGFKPVILRGISLSRCEDFAIDIQMETSTIKEEIMITYGGVDTDRFFEMPDGVTPGTVDRIALEPWNPETPYLEKITAAGKEKAFSEYMKQKETHGSSPGFFIDCADYFFKQGQREIGLQVLSNAAEMELESVSLLRMLGHRLAQLELLELSAAAFESVLEQRPEEPQSYRDLALLLSRQGKYKRAVDLLYKVVMKYWDDRFEGIEVIALMELNNIIARAKRAGVKNIASGIDPRLIKLLDVDIRIVLTWNADLTDIDLWVTEPTGDEAYYSNSLTTIGGLVSNDFTEGYGPEEYVLKKVVPGKYEISVDYYGSDAVTVLGPVTIQVDIFTNYGRKNEKRKSITRRLNDNRRRLKIGEVKF